MNPVALVRCETYQQEEINSAVDHALSLIGGMERYIKPGMRVLIKPNLVTLKKPDHAATTHPAVIEAIVRQVQNTGATAWIGDSPGGPATQAYVKAVYDASGVKAVAQRTGASMDLGTAPVEVQYPEARIMTRFAITGMCAEADAVINIAKLKTHSLTGFSGCVKNLYGAVPGTTKVEYHYRYPDLDDFSDMLLDIVGFIKPVLSIIDAVDGMEGPGPTAGTPRHVGALVASSCPHAADAVGMSLISLDQQQVKTVSRAMDRGLFGGLDEAQVLGETIQALKVSNYKLVHTGAFKFQRSLPEWLNRGIARWLTPRPVVVMSKCVGCGECGRCCPPKAISMHARKPVIDLEACQRCYCCQELCPKSAVKVHRSIWLRMIR